MEETLAIVTAATTIIETGVKLLGDFPQIATALTEAESTLPDLIADGKQLIASLKALVEGKSTAAGQDTLAASVADKETAFETAANAAIAQ